MPSEDRLKGSQNKSQDKSHSKGNEAELKAISESSAKSITEKIAEIDWEKETTNYMKEFLSKNNLNESFCEFAGHGVRKAKKAEYVAFFESYQKTNNK